MSIDPGGADISLRLFLTLIACAALGLDRGEHGRPAGLRTVMLVGLAAALAMAAGNLLLSTTGRTDGSFATMDVMRLPLGILTGIGFIGISCDLDVDSLLVWRHEYETHVRVESQSFLRSNGFDDLARVCSDWTIGDVLVPGIDPRGAGHLLARRCSQRDAPQSC